MSQLAAPIRLLENPVVRVRLSRRRITPERVVRTMLMLVATVATAWGVAAATDLLRHLCADRGAAACPVPRDLSTKVLPYANWVILAATSPLAGLRLRRWWAFVVPTAVAIAAYLL